MTFCGRCIPHFKKNVSAENAVDAGSRSASRASKERDPAGSLSGCGQVDYSSDS
jgi:hypothetical protein